MKRANRLFLVGVMALTVGLAPLAPAATATRDGDKITVQNGVLKLVIDLKAGARVSEFAYKPFGENIVYPVESSGGILMDHVWEQTWPGEFLNRKYDAEIVKPGPEEAAVRVWTSGTEATTKGLRFERLLTLQEGTRHVQCRLSLINTSAQGRVTGYWSQNNFWFAGKEKMTWFRPSTRGIDRMGTDWFTYNWYYVDDSTAGWNAACQPDRRQGMVFLMDFNDLWRIYDNGSAITTEWMYDKVAIPAGKTWTTEFTIIPVAGMSGFVHGSRNAIANFEVAEIPGGLSIEHFLTRGPVPLKDVTVSTRVWGLKKPWTATVPEAKFAALDETVQRATVKATGVQAMPAGIQVTVTGTTPDGKSATETYGDYYGGAEGKNNDPFSMKPYLTFERPQKQKVFLKPDVIQYTPDATPTVLYLRGLWIELFGLDRTFKASLPDGKVEDGWLDASPVGYALSSFPADYPALLTYDIIVLGNIPAAPMDLVGQEMLKDYMEAGGSVLILGGDQSYGQAGFANKRLIELLPVEIGSGYDWRKMPAGAAMTVAAPDHPVARNVAFGPKDRVFYSHTCKAKSGATVTVKAGDRPILVLGSTPKGGKVACVLATTFGVAGRDEHAFWDTEAWRVLMANTVHWLVTR